MLVQLSNMPNGRTEFVRISEEQMDLLNWLHQNGLLIPDFTFEEIDPINI